MGSGGGFGGWLDNVLFSGTFFTVFFIVAAVLVAAGVVTTVVMLIRGKGRRYVLMEMDDDGTMRPVAMRGPGAGLGFGTNAGLGMRNAGHEQTVQQGLNQQIINQQYLPPGQ